MNSNNNYIAKNKLLSQWENTQKHNQNFQNNALLQNNQFCKQNMQNRMQQMQYIKKMQQLRKMQLMQQMQNKIKQYTKNLLEPITVEEDNSEVSNKFNSMEAMREKEKKDEKVIDIMTGKELRINNTPYKQIIIDKKYGGNDYKKTHKRQTFIEDMIIHKVTDVDKNIDKFKEELEEKEKKVKKHNKKLKKIYADEKKEEHMKKFEYRKTYVYEQAKETEQSSDHTDMKKNMLKNYEKQQKEWEKDNIKVSNLVQDLKNKGILTEEQMNETIGLLEEQ